MAGNTIRLHRVLRTTPERLYRAFLDPDAMVKWLPPERLHRQGAPHGRAGRGGDKRTQQKDIKRAKEYFDDYKTRAAREKPHGTS